nr:ANTAR domain-containing protein [Kribbella amoyensis]
MHTTTVNRLTLAATDDLSNRFEDLQDVLGEGPCRDAYRFNQPVVTNLHDTVSARWPEFTRAALESADDLTLLCYPMRPAMVPLGVFSLYVQGDGLHAVSEETQFLADALGAAVLYDPATQEDGTWSIRATVHQATGMVVAQLQVGVDDALAILRAHAYAHGTTLAEIAEEVVQRRLDFREET